MNRTIDLSFKILPSLALTYISGLIVHHDALGSGENIIGMKAQWNNFTINIKHLSKYLDASGLEESPYMPLLYPHTVVFPLHMTVISHRHFPIMYIKMLQVRNHTLQHRPVEVNEKMTIISYISDQRIIDKGLELDMHTQFQSGDEIVWENINTYFFRGKYGEPEASSPLSKMPLMKENAEITTWKTPEGGGFRFARLSGDYNGIHYITSYARSFGFKRDFAHGQSTMTHCIKHLPPVSMEKPVRVDAALKGPVYYNSDVTMKYCGHMSGSRFDLYCEDNPKPSIKGMIQNVPAGSKIN